MYGSFYGWYLKCQSDTQTLSVIPALHRTGWKCSSSIQIITDEDVWTIRFPADAFKRKGRSITVGKNSFGEHGICLDIKTSELSIKGKLNFGALTPLKYDIMGPFVLVPFMECRHMVWSMRHLVSGIVWINGKKYSFKNAYGYWEGDKGRSFPKEYLWTQCCFQGGSLMLSVADIPIGRFHFTGIIGVVLWKGREYRIATYLGAKVAELKNGKVQIVQGNLELEVQMLEQIGRPLKAPAKGDMIRTIHESTACRAFYCFKKKGYPLFSFETDRASFEYEYPL